MRKRHEDRRQPDRGNLGNRAGAGATQDHVGPDVSARHVVDERRQLELGAEDKAGLRIPRARVVEIAIATLVFDLRTFFRCKRGQRLRQHAVDRDRTEAAAHDEQTQFAGAAREALFGRCDRKNARTHGIADHDDLACIGEALQYAETRLALKRAGEGLHDQARKREQCAIGESGDGVLLVDQQRLAEQACRDATGPVAKPPMPSTQPGWMR